MMAIENESGIISTLGDDGEINIPDEPVSTYTDEVEQPMTLEDLRAAFRAMAEDRQEDFPIILVGFAYTYRPRFLYLGGID